MSEESLKLEVRDFGPIGRASLELRPLTVFVGPSNTGKSYLATLIYALHKHFSKLDSNNWWDAEETVCQMLFQNGERLALDVRETRDAWKKKDEQDQSRGSSFDVMQPRAWKLSAALAELIERFVASQGNVLRKEIERCFGASIMQLTRRAKQSEFTVRIRRQPISIAGEYRECVEFNYSNTALSISLPDKFEIEVKGGRRRLADLELEFGQFTAKVKNEWELAGIFELPVLQRVIREIISPDLFGLVGWPAHYLPAGRAELLDSFDLVVGSLIQQASINAGSESRVAGTKSDFLHRLLELGRLKPEKRIAQLSEIEKKILGGTISIDVDKKITFPRFSYKPSNWAGEELPLKNASSMVSEVGPISLYEKYVVQKGQLLIVDEPESHLHPGLQVELFRQLAKLVSEGKRVIVTTHSEWVAEELANTVRRAKLEEQLPRVAEPKPRGDDDVSLSEADVGVWRFSTGGKSGASTVEEIPLGDTGLYDVGFDDVAISSHNEWARISNALGDNE